MALEGWVEVEVPTEADFDMGNLQMMEVEDIFAQVDFRVRESDITMREPVTIGFGYEGQDLPILSTHDILTESWSLDDGGRAGAVGEGQDSGHLGTRAHPPIPPTLPPLLREQDWPTCRSGTRLGLGLLIRISPYLLARGMRGYK